MFKRILKLSSILLAFGLLVGIFVMGVIVYISFDLPQINSLADYNPPIPSKIYSKDGELLLEIGKEYRDLADFNEMPPRIVEAFLAAEDSNFYEHSGVDYVGIMRAMLKNIAAGRIVQGASTITQQVAKSLLLTSERTFTRKIKDLLLAKRIEEKFTKEEILYLYLNQVYLGGGYYGVKAAVKGYFGKTLEEATIAEAALIAGLLVAPGRYSPYVNPEYAKKRQKYVLSRLYKTEKITRQEYEDALKQDIQMQYRLRSELKAGYFTDWIRQRLVTTLGEENFLTNGFEVVTTINWDLQKNAEKIVYEGAKEIDKRQGFSGPIGRFETEEDIEKYNKESRKKIYKDKSNYFTFFSDGSVSDQYTFEEPKFQSVIDYYKNESEKLSAVEKKHIVIGQNPEDPLIEFIEPNVNHKAIVLDVNNSQRMIYVDFNGLRGMIPYDYYKWAHERSISEEPQYWSYVTYPSKIVSKGDQILIKTLSTNLESAWDKVDGKYKVSQKNKKIIEELKKQKFFLVALDQEPVAQAALLSINPKSGEIISLVGGTDFNVSQFNRVVQSNRQPGSAFKPLLYAAGLENGNTPATILLDSPQALEAGLDQNLQWKPRNYDGKFKGPMTYRRALETSRNIPTIRLVQDMGVSRVLEFVKRLKLEATLPNDLSISLGSFGMNLLDLVKTYAIFPNGGVRVKLQSILSIKDRTGKVYELESHELDSEKEATQDDLMVEDSVVAEAQPELVEEGAQNSETVAQNPFLVNLGDRQVYDRRLAYLMTSLLRGVIQNPGGTGGAAKSVGTFIGGKTGTTNNYVDAWFIGFSSDVVTGVWTGFDDNKTLGWGETGSKSALPIWSDFMTRALRKFPESDFAIPAGIVHVSVNKETGRLSAPGEVGSFRESFVDGTEPGAETQLFDNSNQENANGTILDGDDYFTAQ